MIVSVVLILLVGGMIASISSNDHLKPKTHQVSEQLSYEASLSCHVFCVVVIRTRLIL